MQGASLDQEASWVRTTRSRTRPRCVQPPNMAAVAPVTEAMLLFALAVLLVVVSGLPFLGLALTLMAVCPLAAGLWQRAGAHLLVRIVHRLDEPGVHRSVAGCDAGT